MSENLRIGIPSKGRLAELATSLLSDAGIKFRRQNRSLFAFVHGMPIEITFLRTDDIPILCAEGAIDLGITGSDLVAEAEVQVTTRLDLGVGSCRLAVCVPEEGPYSEAKDFHGKRIATSFPHVTKKYFSQHGAEVRVVNISGSVEGMISLGVADGIVDLVETGSTLAANRLRIMDTIGHYQTVLIQNADATKHTELIDRLVRRLEGIIIARAYSLLEYNIAADKLAEAENITPGFKSPTVNRLEDESWLSVRSMVKRGEVITLMEQLEALGAVAIMETKIANCRL